MSNRNVPRDEREYLRHLRDVHARNQGGRCYFCDVEMTPADAPNPKPGTTVTIEHLKGRKQGGGSSYLNTAASCLDCNSARSRKVYAKGRDVPKVKLMAAKPMATAAYVSTAEPDVLVLMNLQRMRNDEMMMTIRHAAGGSFDLKGLCDVE